MRPGRHQQPEQIETRFLGQRAKRGDGIPVVHRAAFVFIVELISKLRGPHRAVKLISKKLEVNGATFSRHILDLTRYQLVGMIPTSWYGRRHDAPAAAR